MLYGGNDANSTIAATLNKIGKIHQYKGSYKEAREYF